MDTAPELPLCFLPKTNQNTTNNDRNVLSSNVAAVQALASFDLSSLKNELSLADERREKAYTLSRKIERNICTVKAVMERGGNEAEVEEAMAGLVALVADTIIELEDDVVENARINAPREGNLGFRFQDVVQIKAYHHFLKTGKLIPQSECICNTPKCDTTITFRDEEYLGGIIGFSHDLARYGVGRAILKDSISIGKARDVASQLMNCLLKFDFRNGPLRKKYDGTKYALKRLETILYELVVTQARSSATAKSSQSNNPEDNMECDADNPENKKAKLENDAKHQHPTIQRINEDEMDEIRNRMEIRDEMREKVIKRCRDSQKAAKQAIFALHRNDTKRAHKLISNCESIAQELLPTIEKEPSLRYGSFVNSLEEYAEAKLFAIWIQQQRLATREDEMPILKNEEYLGGLCDLTGEIGRVAVTKGTQRDVDGVKLCLMTNLQILTTIQANGIPGKLHKKLGPLRRSVEKLEHMLYELSLIQDGKAVPVESLNEREDDEENDGDGDL